MNNQALLQALEDFVMLADTYHFQDMTASELEEVTATQEEIQADFNPDAESEVFEYENGESTLSYMYEVEDEIGPMIPVDHMAGKDDLVTKLESRRAPSFRKGQALRARPGLEVDVARSKAGKSNR